MSGQREHPHAALAIVASRELHLGRTARPAAPRWLSAASGLVVRRQSSGLAAFVVADDELHLGRFDLRSTAPGQLVLLFAGTGPAETGLPEPHAARKAAKPDCEALVELPPFAACPHGALLALGSASRPNRQRAALLAFDAAGGVAAHAQVVDLAPLMAGLRAQLTDLNIEGAFLHGSTFSLLQRGNSTSGINARIDFDWPALAEWLSARPAAAGDADALPPQPLAITRFDLGSIDGVPLSFTDGCALPGGRWVFSAAAEDTLDPYADGRCAGSVVGVVDAGGTITCIARVATACKVEGIAAFDDGSALTVWMVTDADDRARPGLLMQGRLER